MVENHKIVLFYLIFLNEVLIFSVFAAGIFHYIYIYIS